FGRLSERRLERLRILAAHILELVHDARVDDLFGCFLRKMLIHQHGDDRVREEREDEEAHAADPKDTRFTFEHDGWYWFVSKVVRGHEQLVYQLRRCRNGI